MANLSTLTDDFNTGTTADSSKWATSGSFVTGGRLFLAGDSSLGTVSSTLRGKTWDFTFDSVSAKVDKNTATGFFMRVEDSSTLRGFIIYSTNSYITAGTYNSGSVGTTNTIFYDATAMAYLRLRYSSTLNEVYAEYSADNATWTNLTTWVSSAFPSSFTPSATNFRLYGSGGGNIAIDNINIVPATSVAAVVAPSTSNAVAPSLKFTLSLTAPVATTSSNAVAPTLKVSITLPSSASMSAFIPPEVLTPLPVAIGPPVMAAALAALAPEVIAPPPNTITPLVATATATALAPTVGEAPNTLVYAPKAASSVQILPPGEYVRITVPAASTVSTMYVTRRVGPALSEYAAAVAQTEANYGGAIAYYRLSDETSTLQDEILGRNGGWLGTKSLIPGALVDDADTAVYFNGTDTRGQVGVLPTLNVPTDDPATLPGNIDPYGSSPYQSGAGVGFWFYTPEGMTSERYVLAFSLLGSATNTPLTVRVNNGQLVARVYQSANNWIDLSSSVQVNDGQWHFGFLSTGRVLGDQTPQGSGAISLYVDGTLTNSSLAGSMSWYGDLTLGALTGSATTGLWEGGLDEVSFYNYAPSRWEVLEQWNQGKRLSGPPLRLEPVPGYTEALAPTPAVRRSPVIPLNDFYDSFDGVLDRTRWRDASPTARTVNGALTLRANGEQALTSDYFQVKDSSLIIRIDKLPLFEGSLYVGLINEFDIIPDFSFGGVNQFDSFRRHRDIGFRIDRFQRNGRTQTTITYTVFGLSEGGSTSRTATVPYTPDDPNYPSPMKWLRLDIDPGSNGGATWYTSPDAVTWTEQYEIHGGKANAVTTQQKDPTSGQYVQTTSYIYEDLGSFQLFAYDEAFAEETKWRGYMRVLIKATGGASVTDARVDNLNIYPKGVGTDVEILAKPAIVRTSSSNDYLIYAMTPRMYSSAQDVQITVPVATSTAAFVTPPEPVYVYTPPMQVLSRMVAPERAGDAVPVSVGAVTATAASRALVPANTGPAQNKTLEPNQAQAYSKANPPVEISTDKSSPAAVGAPAKRTITLKTRKARVYVTQN